MSVEPLETTIHLIYEIKTIVRETPMLSQRAAEGIRSIVMRLNQRQPVLNNNSGQGVAPQYGGYMGNNLLAQNNDQNTNYDRLNRAFTQNDEVELKNLIAQMPPEELSRILAPNDSSSPFQSVIQNLINEPPDNSIHP